MSRVKVVQCLDLETKRLLSLNKIVECFHREAMKSLLCKMLQITTTTTTATTTTLKKWWSLMKEEVLQADKMMK
jgi:hypothetical protein